MRQNKTKFSPKIHGFKFENSFKIGTEDMGFGNKFNISLSLGLCGGMCFAALDRFFQSRQTELRTDRPALKDRLFKEIFIKQLSTFTKSLWYKVFLWQASPEDSGNNRVKEISSRTKEVWPSIQNSLDRGIPVTLCLICVRGFWKNPAKNHQVVAYDYEKKNGGTAVWVYDPNHPGVPQNVRVNLKEGFAVEKYSSPFLNQVRGFFPVKR